VLIQADARKDEEPEAWDPGPFPWVPLGVLILSGLLYREMSRSVAVGWFVPVFNTIFTVLILAYGLWTLRK
jgi:hypothetical protein